MSALDHTRQIVAAHMDGILACFKPDVKITVLVRTPEHPDRDFCMTDDEPGEVIAMIERRILEAEKQ